MADESKNNLMRNSPFPAANITSDVAFGRMDTRLERVVSNTSMMKLRAAMGIYNTEIEKSS